MSFKFFNSKDLVLAVDAALANCGCQDQQCADRCMHYLKGNIPDYKKECVRYAYIPRYLFSHVAEVRRTLSLFHNEILAHVGEMDLKERVICIGSGPGSDLYGFCDWLESVGGVSELSAGILDSGDWNAQQSIIENHGGWPFKLSRITRNVDLFQPQTMKQLPAKFFTTSFFLSEVADKDRDIVLKNLQQMLSGSKCVLIINDRPEERVLELIVDLAQRLNVLPRLSSFSSFPEGSKSHPGYLWIEANMKPDNLAGKFKWQTNCGSFQCVMLVN